jgi:membrane-bound metal-dependent hydrolase YbcI (DUF457 family)
MTPDLPLFVRGFGVTYGFTHTIGNIVWTTLIAFVLFLTWRVLLRPAVAELSPTWLAERLPPEWDAGASAAARQAFGAGERRGYAALLAVSFALGIASHILWDLFTHEGRLGVQIFPVLDEYWGPLLGVKWMQHGSSVLGLVIQAIWGVLWLRRSRRLQRSDRLLPSWVRVAWWISLPVILVIASMIGFALYGPFTAEFTPQHLAYRMLPPACAMWGALTLVLCLVVAVVRRHRSRSSAQSVTA